MYAGLGGGLQRAQYVFAGVWGTGKPTLQEQQILPSSCCRDDRSPPIAKNIGEIKANIL
jgi:hypothetical protein